MKEIDETYGPHHKPWAEGRWRRESKKKGKEREGQLNFEPPFPRVERRFNLDKKKKKNLFSQIEIQSTSVALLRESERKF